MELEIRNWDLGLGLWTGMGILIENGDWDLVLGFGRESRMELGNGNEEWD